MSFQLGMQTLIESADVRDDAALCRRLGLAFVELNANLPRCLPHALPAEMLCAIRDEYGVDFTLHMPEELDFASIHASIRHGHLQTAVDMLRWAGDAHMRVAVMHLREGVHFTLPNRKQFVYAMEGDAFKRRLLDGFRMALDAADAYGVTLCLENTGDWTTPHLADAMENLLREFPALRLCWDIGHDAAFGNVNRPFFERHAPCVAHMHLHDVQGAASHKALLTGDVDVAQSLQYAAERDIRVAIEVKTAAALELSMRNLQQQGLPNRRP